MKIAFTGPANTGKTTLVEALLEEYGSFTKFEKDFRDVLKAKQLEHSSMTDEDTQSTILAAMLQQLDNSPSNVNLVFDRCLVDVLIYSLHANSKGRISDLTMSAMIGLIRERMRDYDIIFYQPRASHIPMVEREGIDLDPEFIKEIDELYDSIFKSYTDNFESDVFFPKEDCPALLEIFGDTVKERLEFVTSIVDSQGEIVESTESVLDGDNLNLMEDMMQDQEAAAIADKEIRAKQNAIDERFGK